MTGIVAALVWTMLIGASLFFNIEHSRSEMMASVEQDARTNINKDISFRKWATGHGGVYVPVTETQGPVPWLAHIPGRDVTTQDGRALTLLNPAYIIRQVMDSYAGEYGIRGRIIGLKQLNPANAPDPWEKAQLESFARGEAKEAMSVEDIDGKPHLRHLRAMYMTKGCDKCHAILGYREGDMRGAIGVSLPMAPYQAHHDSAARQLGHWHGTIWLAGLLGIGWFGRVSGRHERARASREAMLRQSEARIRNMSDAAGAYLWEVDNNLVYTYVSGQTLLVKGYPPEALLGRKPLEFMPEEDIAPVAEIVQRAIASRSNFRLQHRDITPAGDILWEEVYGSAFFDEKGHVVGLRGTGMGINARKAAEARIRRLTNLYAALSECNQLIVRATSQADLFPEICRAVVQYGGMKMAWIGLLDEATRRVTPVASDGESLGYLDSLDIRVDPEDPRACGATGTAIREARPVWNQDFRRNPGSAPWRERAARHGFLSSAALPLYRDGKVIGAFNLYAGDVNAFDEDARRLLEEMATDISHALNGFDRNERLRLAAEVFEQGKEGIMISDTAGKIVLVNRAFSNITGYSEAEAIGQGASLISSGRHGEAFYREMWDSLGATGHWQGEIWNRRKNGEVYPEWLAITRVLRDDGQPSHYVGIFNDITQHKEAEARIQRLAHFDALTGLPNRALLNDRARHALSLAQRSHEPLAVLFLDLDHFKNINDTLGHPVGDELLVEVGQRMKGLVREEDTVSRQGGDEFIIVLPNTDADGAAHVAAKMTESVSRPFKVAQYELVVTPSIGIAMYPSDGENFEALSKCADTAMYRAKQEGRNAFRFFTPEMQQHSARKLLLEGALRHALEHDELYLHYQPQVALMDERIVGVEALLRWHHPELGTLSPAEFIPIAEDCGLILPIGEWVVRTAAQQLKRWLDAGLPTMVMAVNLSAVQFRHAQLPARVAAILDEVGLAPELMELELTEGVAMDDPLAAIAVMDALHLRGIRLSIDDFGTGYSSLSYLKRFQIYKLKIDQSFVRDIGKDPEDRAIVGAIIRLADSLGLRTIAEGVENAEQRDFLLQHGCGEVQGYFYSRPLPPDALEAFVREWPPHP